MKKVIEQSNDAVIRSNVRTLLINGGIPEEITLKLISPSGLTTDEMKTIEQSELGKRIREQTPALQKIFLEYMVRQQANTALGQELFIELVARGTPVRLAIKQTGFQMSEEDIKKLEDENDLR
jgi:hypothetical protein